MTDDDVPRDPQIDATPAPGDGPPTAAAGRADLGPDPAEMDPDPAEIDPDPADIEPDTKDWTWVLERPCPECGFVASDTDPLTIGSVIRSLTPRWRDALERTDARERTVPGTWSVLEYGAHVRDVNRVFLGRLRAMVETDDPLFANWDQDAAAVEGRYRAQDPAVVAEELERAAGELAYAWDAVTVDRLDRPGRRSNGSVFTVRTLGQYYLHDVVHHLHDVGA